MHTHRLTRTILLLLLVLLPGLVSVQAQDNLLNDPGFEQNYTGRGRGDFAIPAAWSAWYTEQPRTESWMNVPPIAFPHTGSYKRGGTNSLNVGRGGGTFTAAVMQVVSVAPGSRLRGSVYVYMENSANSQAQTRVGIGSDVGENVGAGNITWSGWNNSVGGWQQLSVDATATGGSATFFIYTTQAWPNDPNQVYFDDASLVVTGVDENAAVPTAAAPADSGSAPAATSAPASSPALAGGGAAFVSPQQARDDGGLVHRVQPGDTLAALAVAYGVPSADIVALNNLSDPGNIQPGQELVIRQGAPPEATELVIDNINEEPTGPIETEAPPTSTPEPTPTGPTPIPREDAPPAPVVESRAQRSDPAQVDASFCVFMYDDVDQNRIRQADEALLAGGQIALLDANGAEVSVYETDGTSEPSCFDGLQAGSYIVRATAPDGYGLTTPPQLRLNGRPGVTLTIGFGAAQGVQVATVPTPDAVLSPEASPEAPVATAAGGGIFDFSGFLVFGLAAIVLLGGLGASILLRR